MAVISLPEDNQITRMQWESYFPGIHTSGPFGRQSLGNGVPMWAVSIEVGEMEDRTAGAWKAMLMKLRGPLNQLEVYDIMRPAPLGTMRGTMTLNTAAVQGATSLLITAGVGQASKTLVRGDLIGLGSGVTQQLVMVADDATANASGVISVNIEPPLRNAFSSGAAVTWDKPKALFRSQNPRAGWDYQSVFASGFNLDLLESWNP